MVKLMISIVIKSIRRKLCFFMFCSLYNCNILLQCNSFKNYITKVYKKITYKPNADHGLLFGDINYKQ